MSKTLRLPSTSQPGDAPELPLVDLLDRLLETGVGLSGDVVLSVAGVDLVWLGLRAVLKGIDGETTSTAAPGAERAVAATAAPAPAAPVDVRGPAPPGMPGPSGHRGRQRSAVCRERARGARPVPASAAATRLGLEHDDIERGLVQLVLTVVELVRQLMERQAIRRVDTGSLRDAQVEALGLALMRLEERMSELKADFGLTDDDLRLSVGAAGLG